MAHAARDEPQAGRPVPKAPPRLRTGIPGFDVISEGGVVKGRASLLVGTSGTGKTIFGLQFLAAGARMFDDPGVFVAFEEVPEDIVRNAASFGWDLPDLIASQQLTVVDASPDPSLTGEFDFNALVAEIQTAISTVGAKRVVLDSVGALFLQLKDPFLVRKGLRRIVETLRPLGVTTLDSAERKSESGSNERLEGEDFVADAIIALRHPLERRTRSRTIEVLKLRGGSHLSGEYGFTIRTGTGIEVLPRPAFELKQESTSERVSTGNDDLDRICGGGYFRDSIVLVSGSTGTGKTLLGCEFIRAANRSGERAVYLSFEESRNQLLRNARSWGIDLLEYEQSGMLKLEVRRPERMLLEDLLIDIRAIVEQFEPTRMVIDGLTSLKRLSLPDSFREFAVALISYMKEKDVTVVFTTTVGLGTVEETASDDQVSTMTDAILLLRYVETAGRARRGLLVLKMRGTTHETSVWEYRITSHGLVMDEPMTTVVGFIPGSPAASPDADSARASQAR